MSTTMGNMLLLNPAMAVVGDMVMSSAPQFVSDGFDEFSEAYAGMTGGGLLSDRFANGLNESLDGAMYYASCQAGASGMLASMCMGSGLADGRIPMGLGDHAAGVFGTISVMDEAYHERMHPLEVLAARENMSIEEYVHEQAGRLGFFADDETLENIVMEEVNAFKDHWGQEHGASKQVGVEGDALDAFSFSELSSQAKNLFEHGMEQVNQSASEAMKSVSKDVYGVGLDDIGNTSEFAERELANDLQR